MIFAEPILPEEEQPTSVLLLRRIRPRQWTSDPDELIAEAFFLREGEAGISVFLGSLASPKYLLEKLLTDTAARLMDNSKKLENFYKSNGKTVEELYEKKWRVARVPLSVFPTDVFDCSGLSDDIEPDGHFEICGSYEDFELYALHFARNSSICSIEECLL